MVMQFAPIVPIKYLNELATLSNTQLVLSHWLAEPKYLTFYKSRRKEGDIIILDNGACELEESVPIEDLLNSYIALGGASIVVIPDTLVGDNIKLIKSFETYIPEFKKLNEEVHFMVVPHNLEEIMEVARIPYVDIIGLNKDFERERRAKLISNLIASGVEKNFHLLGIYRNPVKEVQGVFQFRERITGVDSSMPYRIARTGRRIEEYRPYPGQIDLYEKRLNTTLLNHVISEITWFCEFVREGEPQQSGR